MRPSVLALLVLSLAATACSVSTADGAESPRIAFVQDLTAPDADEHALAALQAVQLAVAIHGAQASRIEVAVYDLSADPGAIAEIAADPEVLAAIVAPGADGAGLAEAGVPTVSVSPSGSTPTSGPWRRLVAPIDLVADVLVGELVGTNPCVLSEDPPPDELAGLIARRLDAPSAALEPADAAVFVQGNGCDAVAWAGSPDGGAEVARSLPSSVALVGGDRLLDPDFLDAGPGGNGTRAACPCVDLSTSIEPSAMRFNQGYQAEFGSAPGAYAVEAWDAAMLLLDLVRTAGPGREAVGGALRELGTLEGLATIYRFSPSGELAKPITSVAVSALRAGRWVRTQPT